MPQLQTIFFLMLCAMGALGADEPKCPWDQISGPFVLLRHYTNNGSGDFVASPKVGNTVSPRLVEGLNHELTQLPDYVGRCKRDIASEEIDELLAHYKKGETVNESNFISATRGHGGFSGPIVPDVTFLIKSHTGKDISEFSTHPEETEILFRTDTEFKVTKIGHGFRYSDIVEDDSYMRGVQLDIYLKNKASYPHLTEAKLKAKLRRGIIPIVYIYLEEVP